MRSPVQWYEARDLGARAREVFRTRHGHDPVAVARAPGRVNLVGDHTDYLGGLCLPLPLPHGTWAAWAPRDDGRRVFTSAGREPWTAEAGGPATGWAAYVEATLRAVGSVDDATGATVHVESAVPEGAGLSSSAALICAVALAASRAPAEGLVAPCIAAEQDGVGAPTGGLDQTVALLSVPGHALLLDFGTGRRSPVPWNPRAAGVELVAVDTGTRHAHTSGGYGDRRSEGERALRSPGHDPLLLRRRRHVETENRRVREVVAALAEDDWRRVGALFTQSHRSLRDDYEVSCTELDVTVEAAVAGGALGARMTGGGFGGCALVLVDAAGRDEVLTAVADAFARRGWASPRVLETEGGRPASRE